MGKNLDTLVDNGSFDIPKGLDDEQSEFFVEQAEWRLERLRRTDFDLTGEHSEYAQNALDTALEVTKLKFDI